VAAKNGDRSLQNGGHMTKRLHSRTTRILLAAVGLSVVAGVAVPSMSPAGAATTPKYYVSLGDSYSVGYQPKPTSGATAGYTAYVAKKLKMQLVNFGCGGATTDSILTFTGVCGTPGSYGPPAATDAGTIPLGDSQVTAAEAFITAHSGQIGLITVSIGGNDVTPCANASPTNPVNGETNAISCVEVGVTSITTNVVTLVDDLHSAAGSNVPIVGLTYPDVLLGLYVYPTFESAANVSLANLSTVAFQKFINTALKTAYTSVPDGKFVDVTAATGAYTPLTTLAKMPKSTKVTDVPKGTKVPKAVVEVCELTWYCQLGNIHANTKGYTEIGKLITKAAK